MVSSFKRGESLKMVRYEGTPRGRMGVNIGQIHDDQSCNTLGRCVFVRVFSPRCWQCDHQHCTCRHVEYICGESLRISYVYRLTHFARLHRGQEAYSMCTLVCIGIQPTQRKQMMHICISAYLHHRYYEHT